MDARAPLAAGPARAADHAPRAAATLAGTTLMDYVQSQTLQFILGKRPLSQWSQFQSELQGKGAGRSCPPTTRPTAPTSSSTADAG